MVRPALDRDTDAEQALRSIVAHCRVDLLKHRRTVLSAGRGAGIHQTRVALRRLRAALSLFRPVFEDEAGQRDLRRLAAEAKWLAGECAPARDLEVFLQETVGEVPRAIARATVRLARLHRARARAALEGARFADFAATLAVFESAEPGEASHRLADFGRAVLDQRHHKTVRRGQALDGLDDEELHRLRIAVKKLRYAAEFLRPALAEPAFARKPAKAYIKAATRLQGALGALNDRAMASRTINDIAGVARPSEEVERPLAKLAKQAASGGKRRRRALERAWKQFRKAERFWRLKEMESET